VALVLRTLGDPAPEGLDLLGGEVLVRLRRRHAVLLVGGDQPGDELAVIRLTRDDDGVAAAIQRGVRGVVEPQPPLAVVRVLPVAVEAVLRQDRTDVAVELQLRRRRRGEGGGGSAKTHAQASSRAASEGKAASEKARRRMGECFRTAGAAPDGVTMTGENTRIA